MKLNWNICSLSIVVLLTLSFNDVSLIIIVYFKALIFKLFGSNICRPVILQFILRPVKFVIADNSNVLNIK